MRLLERIPRQREDVAGRVIGGEAVVITPGDSHVHELDPVATFVWERCDGSRSGADLVEQVVESFEVERERATRDVDALLQVFLEKGLVELLPEP